MARRLFLIGLLCFVFACKSKKAEEAGGSDPARTSTGASEPSGWDDVERAIMALGIQGLVLKLDLGGADTMGDRKNTLRIARAHLMSKLLLLESEDNQPTLYAFDRKSLEASWVTTIKEPSAFPAAENPDMLFLVSAHYVTVLDSLRGTRVLHGRRGIAIPALELPFTPTAGAAAQMGTFYVPSLGSPVNNKTLESFSGVTGTRGWGYRSHGYIRNTPKVGGPWGDPKLYFMTERGKITALDAKAYAYRPAGVLWEQWLDDKADFDFYITADSKDTIGGIFVVDRSGIVYCIDRITGTRRWLHASGRAPKGGPQVFGDVCIVPMDDGLHGYDTTNVVYTVTVDEGDGRSTDHVVRSGKIYKVGGGPDADINVGGQKTELSLEVQDEVLWAIASGGEEGEEPSIVVNERAVGKMRAAIRSGDRVRVNGTVITIADRGSEPLWRGLPFKRAIVRVGNKLVVSNDADLSVIDARTGAYVSGPSNVPGARLIPTNNSDDGILYVVAGDAVLYALLPR